MLYPMFKYSIKTEMKRKYYERRLKGFFWLYQIWTMEKDIEFRCNKFK
jgi:hypothetical protein